MGCELGKEFWGGGIGEGWGGRKFGVSKFWFLY